MAGAHEYWNAAGLLYVHGAIAFADAVAIKLREVKSTSENHMDAVHLLGEVTAGAKGRDEALGHLKRLIDEKARVAYSGQSFHARELESLSKHADRFSAWAERILKS